MYGKHKQQSSKQGPETDLFIQSHEDHVAISPLRLNKSTHEQTHRPGSIQTPATFTNNQLMIQELEKLRGENLKLKEENCGQQSEIETLRSHLVKMSEHMSVIMKSKERFAHRVGLFFSIYQITRIYKFLSCYN